MITHFNLCTNIFRCCICSSAFGLFINTAQTPFSILDLVSCPNPLMPKPSHAQTLSLMWERVSVHQSSPLVKAYYIPTKDCDRVLACDNWVVSWSSICNICVVNYTITCTMGTCAKGIASSFKVWEWELLFSKKQTTMLVYKIQG